MNTLDIPFNKFLGLKRVADSGNLLQLEEDPKYSNHLGTVHAGAQFALAEASSGEYLLQRFKEYSEKIIPVVRRAETKYKKPAKGTLYAVATLSDNLAEQAIDRLAIKGRAVFPVSVQVKDVDGNVTMEATIEWFVQAITDNP